MFKYVVGIEQKIKSQAKAARKENMDIDFIILNTYVDEIYDNFKMIRFHNPKNKFLFLLKRWFFRYTFIKDTLNLDSYDFIVLRYPYMDFSSIKFVKKFGKKIYTEHHADEEAELKLALTGSNLMRKSFLKFNNDFCKIYVYQLFIIILIFMEKLYASRFLSKVKGIIAVTDEIRHVELKKSNNYNSITISNGINVEDVPFTKFKAFNGRSLNIIFVASTFAPWQGLDRVLNGLKNYEGSVKIKLFLIGEVNKNDLENLNNITKENIEIHVFGKLVGEGLNELFQKSNMAFSSLAVFRKGMKEACSLKTREYIARGLPFIYGYDDTDLEGNEVFAKKIDANNMPVEFREIISFAKEVSKKKDISDIMRQLAIQKFDWGGKLKDMYNFIANEEYGNGVS